MSSAGSENIPQGSENIPLDEFPATNTEGQQEIKESGDVEAGTGAAYVENMLNAPTNFLQGATYVVGAAKQRMPEPIKVGATQAYEYTTGLVDQDVGDAFNEVRSNGAAKWWLGGVLILMVLSGYGVYSAFTQLEQDWREMRVGIQLVTKNEEWIHTYNAAAFSLRDADKNFEQVDMTNDQIRGFQAKIEDEREHITSVIQSIAENEKKHKDDKDEKLVETILGNEKKTVFDSVVASTQMFLDMETSCKAHVEALENNCAASGDLTLDKIKEYVDDHTSLV